MGGWVGGWVGERERDGDGERLHELAQTYAHTWTCVCVHARACVFLSRTEAPAAILVAWVQVCLCLNLCVPVCMRVLDKERHEAHNERHETHKEAPLCRSLA